MTVEYEMRNTDDTIQKQNETLEALKSNSGAQDGCAFVDLQGFVSKFCVVVRLSKICLAYCPHEVVIKLYQNSCFCVRCS